MCSAIAWLLGVWIIAILSMAFVILWGAIRVEQMERDRLRLERDLYLNQFDRID